ncbi:M23 family metallopeptidase [Patescibacteria group bacterium]|nr:M23 family metallopeptidase [Patescibacteria group bacterium]
MVVLAMVVVITNLQLPMPAGIGSGETTGVHYKTIAQLASTATLEELGVNQEEYSIPISEDSEYLFKTVQTETIISRNNRKESIKYNVRSGESLSSLSADFGITVATLKYANNLSSNTLKVGQELRIPPVDGLFVKVKRNDTLSALAARYKVKVEDIVSYNNLEKDAPIFSGNELLIPGAIVSKAVEVEYTRSGNINVPNFSPTSYSGKFIWPTETATHYISQGYKSYHRALDLNRLNGWGLYASAPGVVQLFTTRGGYGNLVVINHGSGWSTYYGHMSQFKVKAGDYVQQGQLIGIMGSTGKSTGPHIHFEIRQNGKMLNPLDYLPR